MHANCSCAKCTVAFGQQLANIFHTWYEFTSKAETHLDQVLYDVEASTSALKHLEDLIEQDKTAAEGTRKIFTAAGLEEIECLATKCNLLFKAIILLVQKSSERKESSDSDDDDDNDDDNDKSKVETKTDYKYDLLIGPIPDLQSMKTLGLVLRFNYSNWDWLEDRITHCQEQLRYVRKGLLLHLQIARLSQLQSSAVDREDGAFESELVARGAIFVLRKSQLKYIRKKARKQERAQRLRDLRAKREEDNVSIMSASSQTSAATFVDETSSVTKTLVDKDSSIVTDKVPTPHMMAPMLSPPPLVEAGSPMDDKKLNPQDDAHADVTKCSKEANSTSMVSTKLNSFSQRVSETMTDLTHKFFGKNDEFTKDWPSETLEAWVTQGTPYSDPMKVPFGHRRLQYGLKQIRDKKAPSCITTFGRYLEQGPRTQIVIDEVVREANRLQKRERVCLAFRRFEARDPRENSLTLVFFSIREEKPPILFTDCTGRNMSVPYEICKTWEGMRKTIDEALCHIAVLGAHVLEEHYDVQNAKGEIVLKSLWASAIKPGDAIKMLMWPMLETYPLRGFRGPHLGCVPQSGPEADARARQQRVARMQNTLPPRLSPMHPCLPRPTVPGAVCHPIPMAGPPRFPLAGMPRPHPEWLARRPPPPCPPGRWVSPSISTTITIDEDKMTYEEEKQLSFVDYTDELEKSKGVTVMALVARFTNLKDVGGDLDDWDLSGVSDSDSSSDTSSSGSSSIVDI